MKIIGAGFGRTGTISLKQAFEHLGYSCYHMQEVMKAYDRGHVEQWDAALTGNDVDWHALFAGYEATVDFPAGSLEFDAVGYFLELIPEPLELMAWGAEDDGEEIVAVHLGEDQASLHDA